MPKKLHDADLCDRIRELEARVQELEQQSTYYCGCYHYHSPFTWTIANYGTTFYDKYTISSSSMVDNGID